MILSVAVYYHGIEEKESAKRFLEQKMAEAYHYHIPAGKMVQNGSIYEHVLSNSDRWMIIGASESFRGYRHSIVYYSSTIAPDIVNHIIKRCTTLFPGICNEINLEQHNQEEIELFQFDRNTNILD